MMTAADYPYDIMIHDKIECKYDEKKATSAQVKSFTFGESGDIDMMKKALSHQPIAAAVQAEP